MVTASETSASTVTEPRTTTPVPPPGTRFRTFVDASALAAELRTKIRGEVRFDAAAARSTPPTARTTARCRSASSSRTTSTT